MSRLPHIPDDFADADTVWDMFEAHTKEQGLTLYPAQEEAILSVLAGENTIVATPTGSGKSMVALAALYYAVSTGRTAYYTAPLKALVSEKFFSLVEALGRENVGMVTGDSSVNADAPVICATAEILANHALREGANLDVALVVMDEFHYFGDPQRGWAWQVPLLEMPQSQFVLMSATLGDTTEIQQRLTDLTGRDTAYVGSAERPVPLEYDYSRTALLEKLAQLVAEDRAPVYVVSFVQARTIELAQSIVAANLTTRAQRDLIAEEVRGFRFGKGFGVTLRRLVLAGVGVHHAGMLPRYRRLVEHLTLKGLLSVVCGTDTLGVGINVPIRTVLLTSLTKFDGRRVRQLQVREFQQISGRAGRAGFDAVGYVVVQAPEHEIENAIAVAKAGDDPKKRKKLKRKQAPEGFVGWSEQTFENLIHGTPEQLRSHMRITHSTIVNLLARPRAGIDTIRDFLERTHETRDRKLDLMLRALRVGRSLIAGGVVERVDGGEGRSEYRLSEDLGPDFALNQPLSPFALAALDLFDSESETWAMDALSVIEATTQIQHHIIRGQLDRVKGDELAALKADGVEYTERMAILDELDVPRPNGEVLEAAFESYAEAAPWVREIGIEPKAIVADMIEQSMNFSQFVAYYGISRVEGGLLRYLLDVWRALVQTVPVDRRGEELDAIIEWLGDLVVRVDSSLVEEWAKLTEPGEELPDVALNALERTFTSDTRRFTAAVRNALFHRVLLAERAAYRELGALDAESGWGTREWEDAIESFYDEYGELGIDANARSAAMVRITESGRTWSVQQTLADPDGDRDWAIRATVDLDASDEAGEAVVRIDGVGPLTEA
ncbi:DEAD/DEAH box helicase [Brevibacterium yomogidense]|uniref:Putative helicase n=2 Tax=Brevibacterium yomogidense TaxID=946573 RepID=A0A1X6XIK0_9MICO|nr:DEAD/DEAH box helicase [Brevibacterium yomogidense]SLM98357.1 putative helicase [Brevibacterium yomogidense]